MQANLKPLGAATLVLVTHTLTASTLISEPPPDSLVLILFRIKHRLHDAREMKHPSLENFASWGATALGRKSPHFIECHLA